MRPRSSIGLVAFSLAIVGCASGGDCSSPYASSPQFKGCLFANPPNPLTPPGASTWANWTRFLIDSKVDTVPVDPIPVRPLTTDQLDALDAQANHLVRLGHSSHLLKLRGKFWLIDPVFGERASPVSFAGPKRFHAPPLTLEQLPPIEGLILSHDHYDHLDVPTIEYLARRVQRYFVPLGVMARLVDMGVPAERVQEFDWWQAGAHAGVRLTATPAQHFSGRTRELDPTSLLTCTIEATFLQRQGDMEGARLRLSRVLEFAPRFWIAHMAMAVWHQERGDQEAALASIERSARLNPHSSQPLALKGALLGQFGRETQARAVLVQLQARAAERHVPPTSIAAIQVSLGDRQTALDSLGRAFDSNDARLLYLRDDSRWLDLRNETRFERLVERMNLAGLPPGLAPP